MTIYSALPVESNALTYGDGNRREAWVDEERNSHNFAATLAGIDVETLGAMSITEHEEGTCDFCDTVRAEVLRRLKEEESGEGVGISGDEEERGEPGGGDSSDDPPGDG